MSDRPVDDRADIVTVERVIRASPEHIFELLADPARHPEFDGSDSVLSARAGNPTRLSQGARFAMNMRVGIPYKITNEVVEFQEGRRIAWTHWARNVWRYELQPAADGTLVRETFDATNGRGTWYLRLSRAFAKNRTGMEQTLERIAWLTERRSIQWRPEG
jgi:uncharacterized protein YndB with AHSA1/START domain